VVTAVYLAVAYNLLDAMIARDATRLSRPPALGEPRRRAVAPVRRRPGHDHRSMYLMARVTARARISP
jgi:hypothetical protein